MSLSRKDPRRRAALLADIRRGASDALLYLAKKKFTDFIASKMLRDAVSHCITVAGEAATQLLNDGFAKQHPSHHWDGLAGMRIKLVHGYDSVDYLTVWNTIKHDYPDLIKFVDGITRTTPDE
jgi:uncharacterized protein with HEPN domain